MAPEVGEISDNGTKCGCVHHSYGKYSRLVVVGKACLSWVSTLKRVLFPWCPFCHNLRTSEVRRLLPATRVSACLQSPDTRSNRGGVRLVRTNLLFADLEGKKEMGRGVKLEGKRRHLRGNYVCVPFLKVLYCGFKGEPKRHARSWGLP